MDGSEAGVDLVLIQTFLLYYVNQVILMLSSIFQGQFPYQSKAGFYQNKVTISLTFIRRLGYLVYYSTLTCWIWDDYSPLSPNTPHWLSTISYPMRIRGIVVNYFILYIFLSHGHELLSSETLQTFIRRLIRFDFVHLFHVIMTQWHKLHNCLWVSYIL